VRRLCSRSGDSALYPHEPARCDSAALSIIVVHLAHLSCSNAVCALSRDSSSKVTRPRIFRLAAARGDLASSRSSFKMKTRQSGSCWYHSGFRSSSKKDNNRRSNHCSSRRKRRSRANESPLQKCTYCFQVPLDRCGQQSNRAKDAALGAQRSTGEVIALVEDDCVLAMPGATVFLPRMQTDSAVGAQWSLETLITALIGRVLLRIRSLPATIFRHGALLAATTVLQTGNHCSVDRNRGSQRRTI